MLRHKKIELPLYSRKKSSALNIIVADEKGWNKGLELIDSYNDIKENLFGFRDVRAFCVMTNKNGVEHFWIVFKPKDLDLNTISHEIVHAVNFIYLSRGIKPDLNNDEPQAYLTGWVTEVTTKFLKPYIKI
jgi:hypothetical protein